ncbi:MAG: fibronectin type III domain-containing protein [Bacteroidetes bacterium]|nr:fibronectin type III domain-containing protein [Bacteroidota bacterium]
MRIRIGFKDLSIPNQIERARNIVRMMTGNPKFPAPSPTLAFVTNRIKALEAAYIKAANGGKNHIDARTLRLKEMLSAIRELAAYVQMESHGDQEVILSSGFEVILRGAPVPVSKVLKLRTRGGRYVGSIHAVWAKVKGAVAYIVEVSDAQPVAESFRIYKVVAQTRHDIINLAPGKVHWVRITAVGRAGYGLPSDPSIQVSTYGY